jgi:signal transduction histidine kinase
MGPPQRREFLDLMSQEAGRLERLVVEQLELARLDAGALPLETQHVDLLELSEGVVESRYLLFAREGVALICSIGNDADFSAEVDPARLEQILLILMDNALRHTPAGGRVELRVTREDGTIQLAVVDTGEGIPEDAQPFVFDRFYRADPSREGRGAGLGLAIARGLVEAHGGQIGVTSVIGKGSTFSVRLPVPTAPPAVTISTE